MGSSPNCTLKPSNSFEWRKIVFEMVTSMGIRLAKAPNPSRLSKTWQSLKHPKNSSIPSKPDRAHICTISGAIQMTPPPGFSTPPHIPNVNTNEIPPVTTTVFAATTPGNTPFAYRASTSIDPTPMISSAFIEANYEILECLLRYRRSAHVSNGLVPTHVNPYSQPFVGIINGQTLSFPFQAQTGNPPVGGTSVYPPQGGQQKRFTKTHLAIHNIKQREGESVRAFATRTRNLVEHLSTDLPSTYKGLMEKTYTWIEAREVATNGAPNDRRDNFESLFKTPRDILAIEKVAKTFEQPPRLPRRQLAHLVKGIKRKREKVSDTQLGEWKKERRNAEPVETFVLMISRRSCNPRKRYVEEDYNKVGEITFPPLSDKSSVDQSS
ncbi:hypothetical protein Tco_0729291 [Tanacetum coccineum]|uniref:Retrotransposon gag domain-containing protein n=1 Tax=Tanacetum coccineum TaxID=301880 RepID=A0ABQ4YP00_9ASTR